MTIQEKKTPAVLYICTERSPTAPGLAQQRAETEGRALARGHNLAIVTTITDVFGEPDPRQRSGWMQVRELAELGAVAVAIMRWPNALSPRHELRYSEIEYLGRYGCQVRFSWEPLTLMTGRGATR
ncbi:hypothetical protein ABTY53_09610 [Streptomyces noursei]|uniref:hypothetical protein n=1 Tax=Streptomyces noursei TaxID=1971 RepID=UPI003317279F